MPARTEAEVTLAPEPFQCPLSLGPPSHPCLDNFSYSSLVAYPISISFLSAFQLRRNLLSHVGLLL